MDSSSAATNCAVQKRGHHVGVNPRDDPSPWPQLRRRPAITLYGPSQLHLPVSLLLLQSLHSIKLYKTNFGIVVLLEELRRHYLWMGISKVIVGEEGAAGCGWRDQKKIAYLCVGEGAEMMQQPRTWTQKVLAFTGSVLEIKTLKFTSSTVWERLNLHF